MKKVIGFKLPLRIKEVQRRAKRAKLDLAALGLAEPELHALLERASEALVPGVVFDTFAHPDADQPLLSPIPGLAYSLVVATLGPKLSAFEAAETEAQPSRAPVWPVIEETALEEAVRFASALLEDEAARESCELSPINTLGDAPAFEAALRKLDAAKIGVGLENGSLSPRPSCAVSLSWLAKSKAKGKPK